jgi:hypothetical protein
MRPDRLALLLLLACAAGCASLKTNRYWSLEPVRERIKGHWYLRIDKEPLTFGHGKIVGKHDQKLYGSYEFVAPDVIVFRKGDVPPARLFNIEFKGKFIMLWFEAEANLTRVDNIPDYKWFRVRERWSWRGRKRVPAERSYYLDEYGEFPYLPDESAIEYSDQPSDRSSGASPGRLRVAPTPQPDVQAPDVPDLPPVNIRPFERAP